MRRQHLTAFIALATLLCACSLAVPPIECPTVQSSPQPSNVLGCAQAVGAATAVLPAGHPRIVGMRFTWGTYCPPGAYCPLTPPSVGTVMFTFESVIPGQMTDAYV